MNINVLAHIPCTPAGRGQVMNINVLAQLPKNL